MKSYYPTWGRPVAALLFSLFLAGCVATGQPNYGSLGQKVADSVVEVDEEHRSLRVCLLSAGVVEVITDLAQYKGNAELALGKLMLLQNAIDKSQNTSQLWLETDMADVAILFAGVLKDLGKSRIAQILLGGPTISNFLYVAKRATIITVKGRAIMSDINRMLGAVNKGTLDPAVAWAACNDRMEMNRGVLMILTGGSAGR